jgi:hypothetical protein
MLHQIAHGMAFIYSKLPREDRLDYERQSDAEMLRYKEQFSKAKAEHESSERNTPRDAFDIYEVGRRVCSPVHTNLIENLDGGGGLNPFALRRPITGRG